MLHVTKPSIWRCGAGFLQSGIITHGYNSSQMTFNLKATSQVRGSAIFSTSIRSSEIQNGVKIYEGLYRGHDLSRYSTSGNFSASRSPLQNLHTGGSRSNQLGVSLLNVESLKMTPHFEHCYGFHTSATTNDTKKDDDQDTGGSKDDQALSMATRIKIVTLLAATWAIVYFAANYKREKDKKEEHESEKRQIDIGASDYELIDQYGRKRTKKSFLGQWFLLYFGFTHCPDICPEELEKMAGIIDTIGSDKTIPNLLPVFVSVDPERDTPEIIGKYVAEFHRNFVGLTGSKEQIKQAAKTFRVYFSAGPRDEDNDYIVDHSIVMYLMNPQGNFVDYYGSRGVEPEKIVDSIKQNMKNFKRLHG